MAASVQRRSREKSSSARPHEKRTDSRRRGTLSKWGNSLGLRIPQEAAERLNLKAGGQVSVEVGADSITIRPLKPRKRWTEAELLVGVTPSAVGGEVNWGGPVGKEIL